MCITYELPTHMHRRYYWVLQSKATYDLFTEKEISEMFVKRNYQYYF